VWRFKIIIDVRVIYPGGGEMTASKNDPLFIIFEKHFYESSIKGPERLCDIVVEDYLNYLKYSGAIIPSDKERLIIDEVREEVSEILDSFVKSHSSIDAGSEAVFDSSKKREESQRKYFELF